MTEHLDDHTARLLINARGFTYDAGLDRAADLFETDRAAWNALPQRVQSIATSYRDMREHYRAAVGAGVIPDDQSANHATD